MYALSCNNSVFGINNIVEKWLTTIDPLQQIQFMHVNFWHQGFSKHRRQAQ